MAFSLLSAGVEEGGRDTIRHQAHPGRRGDEGGASPRGLHAGRAAQARRRRRGRGAAPATADTEAVANGRLLLRRVWPGV